MKQWRAQGSRLRQCLSRGGGALKPVADEELVGAFGDVT